MRGSRQDSLSAARRSGCANRGQAEAHIHTHRRAIRRPGKRAAGAVRRSCKCRKQSYQRSNNSKRVGDCELQGNATDASQGCSACGHLGRQFSGRDPARSGRADCPASGSQFALLPPDNATGNFTKVVERVPVRINLTRASLWSIGSCPACRSSHASISTKPWSGLMRHQLEAGPMDKISERGSIASGSTSRSDIRRPSSPCRIFHREFPWPYLFDRIAG